MGERKGARGEDARIVNPRYGNDWKVKSTSCFLHPLLISASCFLLQGRVEGSWFSIKILLYTEIYSLLIIFLSQSIAVQLRKL